MRLLNVRLDDDDARLVRLLRDRGISVSDVVRGALRAEAQRIRPRERLDVDELLAELDRTYPAPKGTARTARVDTTDRRAVQRFIRATLRKRR